jgi:hypothetical protein
MPGCKVLAAGRSRFGMSDRAIAAQAGWSLRTVSKMLATYGHGDVGAAR